MKYQIPVRVIVSKPLAGVSMCVQKGRDELLAPTMVTGSDMKFDFDLNVDVDGDHLNFLGKFAQGPKDSRFVYVNSGTYAGQNDTCWSRRAKLSLMPITRKQIEDAIAHPGSRIETAIPGVGRDGGPICAGVKDIEWKVVRK